jgi:outer membrane receptor protein involved in Fe transport
MRRAIAYLTAGALVLVAASPLLGGAQEIASSTVLMQQDRGRPANPLERHVTVHLTEVPLGQALRTLETLGSVRVSFSSDIVPVTKQVTMDLDDGTLREAFRRVLEGTGLEVLAQAGDHLVLVKAPRDPVQGGTVVGRVTDAKTGQAIVGASVVLVGTRWHSTTDENGGYRLADVTPGSYTLAISRIGYAKQGQSVTVAGGQEITVEIRLELSASPLDAVVVTGTLVPTERKAIPTPISVITADDIQRQNLQRVDQVFRGDVPGAIAWEQGPGNDWYSSVAVRGANNLFAVPSVKTFVDGVELAYQQGIATIDPNSIDRIEITRGPQASTLYGAGALGGVLQIFTKKGQLGLSHPEVTGKVSGGGVGGFDGQGAAFQTDNAVSVLGGDEMASYNVGGAYRHVSDYVPSYHSTDWGASVGGQLTEGSLSLSSSARYSDKTFAPPWDTRFQSIPYFSKPFPASYRLRQQTYGVTATLHATPSWDHTITVGYDQSYFAIDQTQPQFTTAADSFLYALASHQAKTSILYHTDFHLRVGAAVVAMLTSGVNYDSYDNISSITTGATRTTGTLNGSTTLSRTPWTNTGYFGQVQVSASERFFLTTGLRAERNQNFGADFGTAWSPRVGVAYLLGVGPATVKLRTSYGESIRAPLPGQRDGQQLPFATYLANPALSPERQRGVDAGIETYVGGASFGVTYYNQRAIDLIQAVLLSAGSPPTYQYQNVNRVKNDGWEFEGRLPLGLVRLAGTYSITHSTVQDLSPSYPAGGYQVGDPILGIPHTSAGATVTYSPRARTTLTASLTHIGHWTNTDWVALYGFYYGGQPYRGSQRAYWIEYPTVTKLALGVSQQLTAQVTTFVRADNVGNNLRYEQDNANWLPVPRTVMLGANVRY